MLEHEWNFPSHRLTRYQAVTPNKRTWVGEEPVLLPQVAGFFLCFPRTQLVLHMGLFYFMFPVHMHTALSSPNLQIWDAGRAVSPCHSLLPSFPSLQDCGMFILPAPFAIYHISSITCTAFPNFYCSLPYTFPWLSVNIPGIPESFRFLILYLSKLLKQNTAEWLTLTYRSKKRFFF